MDPFLIERWIGRLDRLTVFDDASVSEARERARAAAKAAGLSTNAGASLAIVASELARNHLRHARGGQIAATPIERDGAPGVEIVAADRGEGILDPTSALEGGASSAGGLGEGLPAVLRLCDEVDFDVRLRQGTCIRARKFEGARRRREVAILGRPADGERISGDDAAFVRHGDDLLLAIADGLGHGPDAAIAARAAVDRVIAEPDAPLARLLHDVNDGLARTRGAAMSLLRLDERYGGVAHCGVGNATFQIAGPSGRRAFAGLSGVLGMQGMAPLGAARPRRDRLHEEQATASSWDVVSAFTDGLSSRTSFEPRDDGGRRHPLVIAHALLRAFGRTHDDATIVVAV
jgi:anti-sigma regulatory factor (Ser/Thr protein kinase)